jgi:hypothetical protein
MLSTARAMEDRAITYSEVKRGIALSAQPVRIRSKLDKCRNNTYPLMEHRQVKESRLGDVEGAARFKLKA